MRKHSGFTLIEIIAVLVILGILAAVAIPRYMDLQDEAARAAAEGVIASAGTACYMSYSEALLSDALDEWACPPGSSVETSENVGLTIAADGENCKITVTIRDQEVTKIWTRPQ